MSGPLRTYRRRLRQWLNARRLEKEQRHYQALFARKALSVPDDHALQTALKRSFPDTPVKTKGSLHLFSVYHHFNWEDFALRPALERFGSVRHYDWVDFSDLPAATWRREGKARMNRQLLDTLFAWAAQQKPDAVFLYVSGEVLEPAVLRELRSLNAPLVNLALNDKEHFVGKIRNGRALGARDICRYFDLCWTSTEDALSKYVVEGALPVYLPEGANPEIHRPYDLERTIEVSFVGQCYGNRTDVIDELDRRGIGVQAYGFGWPNGPLDIDEMVRLYSRSKINLGFGGVEDHPGTYCLKGRDFEIPMSGSLYLTEHHPELEHVFVRGEEILTYEGIDDLSSQIRYYLAHPEEADIIRQKGRRRALTHHTWEARLEKVFRLLGLLR